MARRRSTQFAKPACVVVIGHNSQVVSTVGFFVGGGIKVIVYTSEETIEHNLALYPGVTVFKIEDSYDTAPVDLPDAPYFICIDHTEKARLVREWLPKTKIIFHLTNEKRGKTAASGFLSLAEPQSQSRRRLFKRLASLRRVNKLIDMARTSELPLILMYGDPDPDAIGAALGLNEIMKQAGVSPLLRYTGEIQRYQNKLLLNYLQEPIERLRKSELAGADLIAVVDAQPGFWKDDPPAAHIVIDHHPRKDDAKALFTDLREDYGSTATILTEYLVAAEIPIRKKLATALLYGLTTDTSDLHRNTQSADIKAYDHLYAKADHNFLSRLNKSQVPMNMLDHIAWGVSKRIIYRELMLIHFGEIETPDILVQVGDLMLLTCGINWVVCAGKVDDKFVVVFRGDGHRMDVGQRAAKAFGKLGSAGGHRTMGRAEIPLEGQHVDVTADILINNLFKRMPERRRIDMIRVIRNQLHGQGPVSPEGIFQ